MPQFFFQVAEDQEPNPKLIANANDILVCLREWKFQQDHLCDPALANDFLDFIGSAQDRHSIFGLVDFFIADQTDSAQPDLGFALQPIAQLDCSAAGADQKSFFFAPENTARQK